LFGEHGYEQTTLRKVAESAGVDVALVSRAFGDKDRRFRAAVAWPWDRSSSCPPSPRGRSWRCCRRCRGTPSRGPCGFDQPELRGALLAGHNIGLCLTRYVLAIEPLASLDAPVLTDITGAQIQRILTTPLPPP